MFSPQLVFALASEELPPDLFAHAVHGAMPRLLLFFTQRVGILCCPPSSLLSRPYTLSSTHLV